MMNRKRVYIVLAAVVLAGCGKDKYPNKELPDNTPAKLELNVGIGSLDTRAVAIGGIKFLRESQINVVLTDYDGGTTKYNKSERYVYKDQGSVGVWVCNNTTAPLQLDANDAMALAHYPAQLPAGSSYNVTTKVFTPVVTPALNFGNLLTGGYNADNSFWFGFVEGKEQSEVFLADGEIDYMYGKMTNTVAINNVNKLAQIKMNHALTMVVFNIYKSNLNPAPSVVKSIKIKNINSAKALKYGTFSIPDGVFTPSASAIEYTRTMDNFPDNSYFGMMMFPASIKSNEVVAEFLVDDQTYTLPIDACELVAGSVNLYRICLTPVRAELVGSVKVIDWGTGTDKEFEIN